jgi:hypothetical protein
MGKGALLWLLGITPDHFASLAVWISALNGGDGERSVGFEQMVKFNRVRRGEFGVCRRECDRN